MKTLWSLQRFCGCRSKFNFERRRFRPCQYYWSAPWVLLRYKICIPTLPL